MASLLDGYKGILPYASELFGVYQPLMGWKSRLRHERVHRETLQHLKHAIDGMKGDQRIRAIVKSAKPLDPTIQLPARVPSWLQSTAASAARDAVFQFRLANQRTPSATEVAKVVPDSRTAVQERAKTQIAAIDLVHESVVAGVLNHLTQVAPTVVASIANGLPSRWQRILPQIDLLDQFDPTTQRAYLSPIGMIHLYREYFFDLETFLGPPVGHVWVSPGGSLEVYEVHTTRSTEERLIESSTETISRSEQTDATQDELSSAVSRNNTQNMGLGVSASGGFSVGVFHASVNTNFNFSTAQQVAQQEAHKETRSQSEKVSSEIRKNMKTVFKTTLEKADTYSRRYVLQNTTAKLANYELRRKMRKVAVQVQHIGTQLCWQLYIDDPGRDLGIASLVHVAKPDDPSSAQPPDAPQPLEAKETQFQFTFPFKAAAGDPDTDDDFTRGANGSDKIVWQMPAKVASPAAGYTLSEVNMVTYTAPDPSASIHAAPSFSIAAPGAGTVPIEGSFTMKLDQVNFDDQPYLVFNLRLLWAPPDPKIAQADYEKQLAGYKAKQRQEEHALYVTTVRNRIEAAGQVQKRVEEDLRTEERSVVFDRLIQQVLLPAQGQSLHVGSELVRAIFDVEKMLYFVAPDWWVPRKHYQQNFSQTQTGPEGEAVLQSVKAEDETSWSNNATAGRDNYLVTEASNPAPLGSSLGWLLQLDGDDRRNAFLNSPWVKAVVPIRRGHEKAALNWLTKAHVEGSDGLDAQIDPSELDPAAVPNVKNLSDAIYALAAKISEGQSLDNTLASEKVFQNGFDPLAGGFQARPFDVFDQWIEVLPTDQIVAMEYEAKLP